LCPLESLIPDIKKKEAKKGKQSNLKLALIDIMSVLK